MESYDILANQPVVIDNVSIDDVIHPHPNWGR
jgi:hypothetical protein